MLCAWHVTETSETQKQNRRHHTAQDTAQHIFSSSKGYTKPYEQQTNVALRADTRERMTAAMVRTV